MERRNTEKLDMILNRYLRDEGLETPILQYRLITLWPEIVGADMARMTEDIFIRNQTLFVKVSSSVIRSELSYKKTKLVSQLNNKVGANVVVDLCFI
jgi:predicted nucleic acid-binding Zn ribbon protein